VFRKRAGPPTALVAAVLAATAAHAALLPREVTSMAGKPAPIIKAKSVQGMPVNSEAARGKVLLVNFFASWCPPCNKELDDLKALRARIPADKLAIVGVAMDPVVTPNTVSQVKPVVEKHGLNFPVVLATKALVAAYECPGFPATYVVNGDGKFFKALYGYHPPEKLEAEVKLLSARSARR
jgi:cytochrome c biogenesis protein CcmG/thiol:disulfide interchange protein DsbE